MPQRRPLGAGEGAVVLVKAGENHEILDWSVQFGGGAY